MGFALIRRRIQDSQSVNNNQRLDRPLPDGRHVPLHFSSGSPFVTEREKKFYFVRETKSMLDEDKRRTKENQKIACGQRHFETIGAVFAVVTKLKEV